MRLRHIKGAEEIVSKSIFCINKENLGGAKASTFFDSNNPIELELGMGKGKFIISKALNSQNINYIGVEKYASVVIKAIEKLNDIVKLKNVENGFNYSLPLKNLMFICDDIENLLYYFEESTINKIYLNFSDPWPKKRHAIRRITHSRFLTLYEKLLINNGCLEFKTDNKDLFDFSLEEIKKSNLNLISYTYDLHNDNNLNKDNIMTEYEEKFSKKGNSICKLIAKK